MSTVSVTNIKNAASASNNLVLDASGNTTAAGTVAMGSSYLRNRIINGDMRIDQRNAGASVSSGTSANTYTVDRWYVFATGAAVTSQRVAGSGSYQYACRLTGASSNTLVQFVQRIESFNVYDLAGNTATFSCVLKASTNTSVIVYFAYPTATDNYTATTAISNVTFNATTTATTFTTQISIPAGATTGLQVLFAFNSGLASGTTFDITGVQLEVGTVATPFERRLYGTELMLCQRYLPAWNWSGSGNDVIGTGYSTDTVNSQIFVPFPVTPRIRPTGVTSSGLANIILRNGSNVGGAPTAINVGVMGSFNGSQITVTTTVGSPTLVAGQGAFLFANGAAQILFTGCEL